MENLSKFVKFDGSGNIDIQASVDQFRTNLEEYAVLQAADLETVGNAVEAVFDEYKGTRLNLPVLASFAAAKIGTTPKTHQDVCERVMTYVRSAKDKYVIGKGRTGGAARLKDLPAPAPQS